MTRIIKIYIFTVKTLEKTDFDIPVFYTLKNTFSFVSKIFNILYQAKVYLCPVCTILKKQNNNLKIPL